MSVMKNFIMMIMLMVVTSTMSHADEGTRPPSVCWLCLMKDYICNDPHFSGFDGTKFDIYNTGDFMLLKESDGSEISITISNRWGKAAQPWITEIRARGPGGPWMKAIAATATPNPPIPTIVVDGVGTIDESYTDPTSSLQVKKIAGGAYIEFVAPRWTLSVRHMVAHVVKDGWHYFNMGVSITSLLKIPVTGMLGVTYKPEMYAKMLGVDQVSNETSTASADHSSSARSLLMSHAKMLASGLDEVATSTPPRLRRMLAYPNQTEPPPEMMCCKHPTIDRNVMYNSSAQSCCGGDLVALGSC
jgi:hypothetical protein